VATTKRVTELGPNSQSQANIRIQNSGEDETKVVPRCLVTAADSSAECRPLTLATFFGLLIDPGLTPTLFATFLALNECF
jgi:hypothetical protein